MRSLWIGRLLGLLFVIFGVATLVFFLIHLVPGDPIDFMLGDFAQAADRDELRRKLGLDQPLLKQYLHFIGGVFTFDFGSSFHFQKPVIELIRARAPATIQLALAAIGVALVIALPMGVLAAVRKNTAVDRGAMAFALVGISIPSFWLGPLLILFFSLTLGWFPVSGREGWSSLVLPAITLGMALSAILSRMIRSSLLEVLHEDYIRTAKAKGLTPFTIVVKHGLRNALLPVVTLLGMQLGAVLAGAVITETVFAWPGIGKLTIDAILSRDYPVVQACVLLISITYVVVNLCTDLLYSWIDPRVRIGGNT